MSSLVCPFHQHSVLVPKFSNESVVWHHRHADLSYQQGRLLKKFVQAPSRPEVRQESVGHTVFARYGHSNLSSLEAKMLLETRVSIVHSVVEPPYFVQIQVPKRETVLRDVSAEAGAHQPRIQESLEIGFTTKDPVT